MKAQSEREKSVLPEKTCHVLVRGNLEYSIVHFYTAEEIAIPIKSRTSESNRSFRQPAATVPP